MKRRSPKAAASASGGPAEAEGEAKPAATETAPAKEGEAPPTKKPKRKETRKRVRRVGKAEPRKFVKIDPSTAAAAAGEAAAVDAAARPDGAPMPTRRVLSKHDEKWNNMFDRLLEYKKANNHTLVPQCYHDDPRLGRWVHYQRVEYWIYQQSGTGKITPERIGRLEAIGFEWDPQKAQWNIMFDRLVKYKEEIGHCKVPKGYAKDTELANWVRNQRLEQANLKKGKKISHDFRTVRQAHRSWLSLEYQHCQKGYRYQPQGCFHHSRRGGSQGRSYHQGRRRGSGCGH